MTLDPQRFPRAAAYLAQLPHGIGSYPECQVLVDGRLGLAKDFSELAAATGIPLPVREFLEGKVTEAWMPEVISAASMSMARDVKLATDDELRAWCFQDAMNVFDSPLNKMLMKVMSPTLVVMGAAKRWNNWRLGSTLTAKPVKKKEDRLETEIDLSYPEHLYDDVSLIQLGQVFLAAVVASNGKEPQVTHDWVSSMAVRFVVSWQK
jgi:hypothetical protein